MKTIILRLKGMQSWGDSSKEVYRETLDHPTFSGVIGLLRSAMGIFKYDDEAKRLESLKMAIRVNNPGRKELDYHTASGFLTMNKANKANAVTYRRYLSDADFFVALAGENELIDAIIKGLKSPAYHLYLGRLAFTPSLPVFMSVTEENEIEALKNIPSKTGIKNGMVRFIVESNDEDISSDKVKDMPCENGYKYRRLKSVWINLGEQ